LIILQLSNIGISNEGLRYILGAIPKDLKHLNLSGNNINRYGVQLIFEKLRSCPTEIECIDLRQIKQLSSLNGYASIENKKNEFIKFLFDHYESNSPFEIADSFSEDYSPADDYSFIMDDSYNHSNNNNDCLLL
jgi:hypothetical protein